jgi:hypothetical protein
MDGGRFGMDGVQQGRIMVNGRFFPLNNRYSVKINRGMVVWTSTGVEAGFSAGVVVPQGSDEATHLLLGRLPITSEYRLIPVQLIARIADENIHLNVDCNEILKLHLHQPA